MLDQLVNVFDQITKGGRLQELSLLANDFNFSFKKRSPISSERTEIRGFELFSKKGFKRFLGVLKQESDQFNGLSVAEIHMDESDKKWSDFYFTDRDPHTRGNVNLKWVSNIYCGSFE